MSMHLILKGLLVFIAGILFTLGIVYVLGGNTPFFGSAESGEVKAFSIEQEIDARREGFVGAVVDFVSKKVVPAVDESAVVSPVKQTTQDVQKAIESVTSLPDQQRAAICKQVCE